MCLSSKLPCDRPFWQYGLEWPRVGETILLTTISGHFAMPAMPFAKALILGGVDPALPDAQIRYAGRGRGLGLQPAH
jgi:hypothetical protein